MILKRLEIVGFKSFRDRLVLDFPGGISAIVGPNGCGKSNIVDAMRWVMGEQRVRSLRSTKMEEVIFAGTQDYPPMGMAEVTMILARREGFTFPEPYASCEEVTVSRRLFRDGESLYAINGVPCRLLDVREFFMGTGVGSRGYAIIEQSSVADLVEARPEDRRVFIEEAAGISKYRSRREAAVRKMEATKQNLLRLNDVLKEVKSSLNSLSRQAKRAEQYRALKRAVKEKELLLARSTYEDLRGEREGMTRRREALANEEAVSESRLTRVETALEEERLRHLAKEGERSRLQEELFDLKNRLRLKEQAIEFARKRIEDLQVRRERWAAEEEKGRKGLEELKGKMEAVASSLAAAAEERDRRAREVEDLEGLIAGLREGEREIQEALEENKRRHIDQAAEKARLRNVLLTCSRNLEDINRRQERDLREKEGLVGKLASLREKEKTLQAELDMREEELSRQVDRRETAQAEVERFEEEMREQDDVIAALKDELGRKSTRLLSLKEFHEGYGWCGDATRSIMTSGPTETRAGLMGLVADCLRVSPPYETAVEAVLGEKLQYVICRSQEDGVRAIDYLKARTLGRTSFVPVELRASSNPPAAGGHLREAVPLLQHVEVEEPFRPIAEYLLGDVLVIPDLRFGLSLWRRNGFRGTFVTPEGDMISPQGVLTGGSPQGGERGLLRDKREMRELETAVADLRAALEGARGERKRLEGLLAHWREELREAAGEVRRLELAVNGLRKDRERLGDEGRRLEQVIEVAAVQRANLEADREACLRLKGETEEALVRVEEGEQALRGEMEDLKARYQALRSRREGQEHRLTEAKVRLAALLEQGRAAERERENLAAERKKLALAVEEALREGRACGGEVERLRGQIEADEGDRGETRRLCGRKEEELEAVSSLQKEIEVRLVSLEAELREAKGRREELGRSLAKADLQIRETDLQMENLRQMIAQKHDVDLALPDEAYVSPTDEEVQALRDALLRDRQAVESFGEVNLLAIAEHEEKKGRHDFLIAQINDLNASLASLERTIARINRISRERFAETYQAVSRSFRHVFARLFPGGKGELLLTDEENLLETGVDMEIRLPGKRLQNVGLLSGGEKSLAALALIMAIVFYKPTPFLVLDEVDAALDDGNVGLFADLLKEVAAVSQVIVVTHNKRTMEAAGHLYGVTMESKGVSKIVAVDLN